MELQTISKVSKACGISARMLRYYEQVGLIESRRDGESSYRIYDEAALKRIQQIIILRKLQIPVKQICIIMQNPEAGTVIDIFKRNIAELEKEMSAIYTIKAILENFVSELSQIAAVPLNLDLLSETSVLKITNSLSLVQKNVKERHSMNELNKAAEILNRLHNVRVVYVPPMTMAAVCEKEPEKAWLAANDFVSQNNLLKIKPDLRIFRFEHANATGQNFGGFEVWVSIPDDFAVCAPIVKKKFLGGQYAAHVTGDSGFETWLGLQDWVNESDKYQYDAGLNRTDPPVKEIESFGGMRLDLEEVLNYQNDQNPLSENQFDLLLSVKNYEVSKEVAQEIPNSKEKCGFKVSAVTKNKFRIMGYTKIMAEESDSPDTFLSQIKTDGRLDILKKHKKCGAPVLAFASHDLDSQMKGGWRYTVCLAESDIADIEVLMEQNLYTEAIDASKWLIFEYRKGDTFDDHSVALKLGYKWNGVISGSITVMPDNEPETMYCWYPVK